MFFLATLLLWFSVPAGLDEKAWHLFVIFLTTIVGFVAKPLPMGPIALIGLFLASFTKTLPIKDCLVGFSDPLIWMIVFVFFIARGCVKTRLGERVAYMIIRAVGKSSLGLGYGVILTEVILGAMIPSNTARSGGIILPIVRSICEGLGSFPNDHKSSRKLGSFLMVVSFQGNLISSALFLTGMVCNPFIQKIAEKHNILLTWSSWLYYSFIPGILTIILMPLIIYYIYPPLEKKLPHAITLAQDKLKEMGPMSTKEKMMASLLVSMVGLWAFGDYFGITALMVALFGVTIISLTKVLTWDDMVREKEAWHILTWLSILITFSIGLENLGFIKFFSQKMTSFLGHRPWQEIFILLNVIYFYSHYCFASTTAHVSAFYAAFLGVGITSGVPPLLCALSLAFFSSFSACLTHYGSVAGAMMFGTGYVPIKNWWGIGFLLSLVYLTVWMGLGALLWIE
jgi:DASS family divalent anion:Na+ symporter